MEKTTTGFLYGIMYNDTLMVLTFSINSYNDENEDEKKNMIDYTKLQLNLPGDVYFCGILHIGECGEINPDVFKVTDTKTHLFHILDLWSFDYHEKIDEDNVRLWFIIHELKKQFTYLFRILILRIIHYFWNILLILWTCKLIFICIRN